MPLTSDDERRKKSLLAEINRLDNSINVASDNGLFSGKQNVPKNAFVEIQNYLKDARKCLYGGDIVESESNFSYALKAFDDALYNSSKTWRFSNLYAGNIWIYLVGFLVAVLPFYWIRIDRNALELPVRIQQDALYAATWVQLVGSFEVYGF